MQFSIETASRVLFGSKYNYAGKSKRLSIMMVLLTFLFPFYVITANHFWHFRFAIWSIRTEPFLFGTMHFTYYDPFSTIIFWLPEMCIAIISYRFCKSEFSKRLSFIANTIIATVILFIFYFLVLFANNWSEGTLLFPLPYTSILALTVSLKIKPPLPVKPWIEKDDSTE